MVLPSRPPMTAPPTVPAMQLNSELRELPLWPEGAWHPARAPRLAREMTSKAFFMAGMSPEMNAPFRPAHILAHRRGRGPFYVSCLPCLYFFANAWQWLEPVPGRPVVFPSAAG